MSDILFKTDEYVFSYRIAGICIRNGKILLQKATDDTAYAFPGGHVSFGETHEQTLVRELREEIAVEVKVGKLRWVGELFFPWGTRRCHQICLYYEIELCNPDIPLAGTFVGREQLHDRNFDMEFHWIDLETLDKIEVYPTNTAEMLQMPGVVHFQYKEYDENNRKEFILQ